MKTILALALVSVTAAAFAIEASPRERRLICHELVRSGAVDRTSLNICLQEFEIGRRSSNGVTVLTASVFDYDQTEDTVVNKVCTLRYRGPVSSPRLLRNKPSCRRE